MGTLGYKVTRSQNKNIVSLIRQQRSFHVRIQTLLQWIFETTALDISFSLFNLYKSIDKFSWFFVLFFDNDLLRKYQNIIRQELLFLFFSSIGV